MARRRIGDPPPEHRFACPLCRDELGQEVIILAELDATPGFLSVADLSGCAHADVFGSLERLTFEEEARLITTALETFESLRGRPPASGTLPPDG
jgi:hypothetical protein